MMRDARTPPDGERPGDSEHHDHGSGAQDGRVRWIGRPTTHPPNHALSERLPEAISHAGKFDWGGG